MSFFDRKDSPPARISTESSASQIISAVRWVMTRTATAAAASRRVVDNFLRGKERAIWARGNSRRTAPEERKTRLIVVPAGSVLSSVRSSSTAVGWRNSPQHFSWGNSRRSMRRTCSPRRAKRMAEARPAGPPPITMLSKIMTDPTFRVRKTSTMGKAGFVQFSGLYFDNNRRSFFSSQHTGRKSDYGIKRL